MKIQSEIEIAILSPTKQSLAPFLSWNDLWAQEAINFLVSEFAKEKKKNGNLKLFSQTFDS